MNHWPRLLPGRGTGSSSPRRHGPWGHQCRAHVKFNYMQISTNTKELSRQLTACAKYTRLTGHCHCSLRWRAAGAGAVRSAHRSFPTRDGPRLGCTSAPPRPAAEARVCGMWSWARRWVKLVSTPESPSIYRIYRRLAHRVTVHVSTLMYGFSRFNPARPVSSSQHAPQQAYGTIDV